MLLQEFLQLVVILVKVGTECQLSAGDGWLCVEAPRPLVCSGAGLCPVAAVCDFTTWGPFAPVATQAAGSDGCLPSRSQCGPVRGCLWESPQPQPLHCGGGLRGPVSEQTRGTAPQCRSCVLH